MVRVRAAEKQVRSASVTIDDVARAAGVSTATVSRVVNGSNLVTPDTLQKVQAAISALGYIPNGSARALASRSFRTTGVIAPTIDAAIYSKMIGSLQRTLEEQGLVLLVAASEYSLTRELESVRALIERGVDAIVLVGRIHDPSTLELIRRAGLPLVLMCIHESDDGVPTVGWDNRTGGAVLATHLADLGHTKFGIISGITDGNDRATERLAGFLDGLQERGIEVSPDRILPCKYTFSESAKCLTKLMEQADPPTAILCGNDVLAAGAVFECTRRGIAVPRDVSIAGYDDLELAGSIHPALTTLRVPADAVGELTAKTVIGILNGAEIDAHVQVDLELVVRGSTGPHRP
jgi:LacI family transcriptional regulator